MRGVSREARVGSQSPDLLRQSSVGFYEQGTPVVDWKHSQGYGSSVIPRRARHGLAGLGPHNLVPTLTGIGAALRTARAGSAGAAASPADQSKREYSGVSLV